MKNQPFKIGAITSSISLSNYVRTFMAESTDDIRVSSKGLDEAIPVGRQMEKEGVEVIISRKGTAYLLRETLQIPVLSVPMSSFDILTCLKQAKALGPNILLPCFRNELAEIDIMQELLDIKILQGVYHDQASLEELVFEAKNQGCQVVIGAGIAMRCARENNLEFVEIQTSKEIIDATIESAKSVVQANRKEQERAERYRSILDSASEGIIALDRNGIITNINRTAKDLLKINDADVTGKPIARYLPDAPAFSVMDSQKPVLDKLERVNKELFIFNYQPITLENKVIGSTATFKDITNVMRSENEVRRTLAKGLIAKYSLDDLIHESRVMRDVVAVATQFATTDSTVLIAGETGTGKEIVSQSIHNLSRRKNKPFVSLNCAALPDQLLESELFGYEEGAFTGSRKGGKPGLFEIAHHGTILLDEISATSREVQPRLLRVLQEREVMRIGGIRLIPVDVRVIATSNKDLGEEVHLGNFREDLFFRLNILPIHLPALRERNEDIPLLIKAFNQNLSLAHKLEPIIIPKACVDKLKTYSWPGNVRQLLNFIEQLSLLCRSGFKPNVFDKLYAELTLYAQPEREAIAEVQKTSLREQLHHRKRENEADIVRKALEKSRFNKGKAAQILGISRTTLWKKLKEFDIQ
jgi:PAS domain S-box-containing protein